ncbi:MAG: hypothetical protein ACXQS3_07120 [Candidatus Methanofastidiosia archaeon]
MVGARVVVGTGVVVGGGNVVGAGVVVGGSVVGARVVVGTGVVVGGGNVTFGSLEPAPVIKEYDTKAIIIIPRIKRMPRKFTDLLVFRIFSLSVELIL